MRIKNLFKKVFLVVIIVTLSMSVDAQYNRRGSNNTNNNGSSIVEEAANGVINGVFTSFDRLGRIIREASYVNGQMDGNCYTYYPLFILLSFFILLFSFSTLCS